MNGGKRDWVDIYDDLLRYQADLSYDLEQMFFRASTAWVNAKSVLDFGAGNSYYSSLLAHMCPEKHFICLEKNSGLAEIARRNISSNQVKIIPGSFEDLGDGHEFDFVFSRHALSYLLEEERDKFVPWVARNTSSKVEVLIIDAEDDAFFTFPGLPLLEGGNKKFQEDLKESGGNRSLRGLMEKHFTQNGFSHVLTRSLVVHSAISGRKYLMAMFMKAVAEIDHGSPLPIAVRDEIDAWAVNRNSYLQYGMFGSLFVKVQ